MRISNQTKQQIKSLFKDFDNNHTPGSAVGISHGNNMIFQQGFGQATLEHFSPITADTVFDVGSIAKQFTAMAIALLEEQGKINIEDAFREYLPEFNVYAREVTVDNLLHHTSGIRNYTVLAYYMMGYQLCDCITADEIYSMLNRLNSLAFQPGEKYEYSDSNYFLLAMIIERITGWSLDFFTREHIFKPLGMNSTFFRQCHSQIVPNRAYSYVSYPVKHSSPCDYRFGTAESPDFFSLNSPYEHVGAEGLFTSVNDLFKWSRNFVSNQLGNRNQELIERVTAPGSLENGTRLSYGFGLGIGTHFGRQYIGHDGAIHGYTSSLSWFPDDDLTIIILSNHDRVSSWEYRDLLLETLSDVQSKKQVRSPLVTHRRKESEHTVSRGLHETISGKYLNPDTATTWEIINVDDQFKVVVNQGFSFLIAPTDIPLNFQPVDAKIKMQILFKGDDSENICFIHATSDGKQFYLQKYMKHHLEKSDLEQYIGEYFCEELNTRINVTLIANGLRIRNINTHLSSMDLDYYPTIENHFLSNDPHPGTSQITFIREVRRVVAFQYRDYDGDRREDLLFKRIFH